MRGPLLALAVGLAFVLLTGVLAARLYSDIPFATDYRFLGPVVFALLGAGALIAFFLWLRRKR